VKAIRSELKLQAMDFWMRNPDYLADELVTMVQAGKIDGRFLNVAWSLLNDPEPDLHWYRCRVGSSAPTNSSTTHSRCWRHTV
jgi:hypothetical protein